MCSARPAAVPPPWDPARGCIEGIELLKCFHSAITCAPVPRPVSHLTAAAAAARDRFLRLPKAINTKYEITFGRTFGFVNRRIADAHESDFEFSIYSLGTSQTPIPRRRRPRRADATRGAAPGRKF